MQRIAAVAAALGSPMVDGAPTAWGVTVGADQGVRLHQATGLASGWLNMRTARGWVVCNLPVPAEEVCPCGRRSAAFDLGVAIGTAVPVLEAAIDFTATPAATTPAPAGHPLRQLQWRRWRSQHERRHH